MLDFARIMRGMPICAANKFAELKLGRESRNNKTMEMGAKYMEMIVYMHIKESERQ